MKVCTFFGHRVVAEDIENLLKIVDDKKSDFVVTYVRHTWGGAAQFKEIAEKSKKHVINI